MYSDYNIREPSCISDSSAGWNRQCSGLGKGQEVPSGPLIE